MNPNRKKIFDYPNKTFEYIRIRSSKLGVFHFQIKVQKVMHNSSCSICHNLLIHDNYIKSKTTDLVIKTYKSGEANCQSKNVVYCIICSSCGLQYVGITTRKFGNRLKEHLRGIKRKEENKLLYKHFKNCNSDSNIEAIILDNSLENKDNDILRSKELFWTKLLMTAMPFGFNDNIRSFRK